MKRPRLDLRRKRQKPPRYLTIGIVMALMGTNIEILSRCLSSDLAGHQVGPGEAIRTASLAGWTSLWMLPVYGVIGIVLGKMNERANLAKLRMIYQCFIALVFILAIELATGLIVNEWLGLAIWNYDNEWGNLYGQICIANSLKFLLILSPFGFWADDTIRWIVYDEPKPDPLVSYYRFFKRRDLEQG